MIYKRTTTRGRVQKLGISQGEQSPFVIPLKHGKLWFNYRSLKWILTDKKDMHRGTASEADFNTIKGLKHWANNILEPTL